MSTYQMCYERQLLRDPSLSGKIKVMIKISPIGRVLFSKVITTTMKNRAVEGCIAKHIKRLRFPKTKSGKSVSVRYSFRFKPAN